MKCFIIFLKRENIFQGEGQKVIVPYLSLLFVPGINIFPKNFNRLNQTLDDGGFSMNFHHDNCPSDIVPLAQFFNRQKGGLLELWNFSVLEMLVKEEKLGLIIFENYFCLKVESGYFWKFSILPPVAVYKKEDVQNLLEIVRDSNFFVERNSSWFI